MKVLDVLSDPIGTEVVESPGKDAVSVYVLDGWLAVMSQDAVPVLSVVAVHDSELSPFSVKVTGSLTSRASVCLGFVKMADTGVGVEKLPETGWMAVWTARSAAGEASPR